MSKGDVLFGVAGNSQSFYAENHKSTSEAGAWCKARGIDAFEYSFGRGVSMTDATARELGRIFSSQNVKLSVHSPYYINFANPDPKAIESSIMYVMQSIEKVKAMGGDRVVVHPGGQGKVSREQAVAKSVENLQSLAETIKDCDIKICLETMGKVGQIGTLDEIITFCKLSKSFYPCIDFGHLNARDRGILKTKSDFERVFSALSDNLPSEKVKNMHIHFSKIRYSAGGEVEHLTFSDTEFGPDFEPMLDCVKERGLTPIVICESDGTQAEDTIAMKKYYFSLD